MLKIGVTGGIGSGKTTVCRVFEVLGIPVFYADTVAKKVMLSDPILIREIKSTFGEESYSIGGELNRKYLAEIVFNNQEKLKELNALVHPAVFRAFDDWVKLQTHAPYIIKEAALLFESGSYESCDFNILVTSPLDLKLSRVTSRDQVSPEEVLLRMDKQFSDDKKAGMADFMLLNDERQLLVPQILKLHAHFLSLTK